MTVVLRLVLLVVIWVALWADVSVANVLSGLVVASLVLLCFRPRRGRVVVRPLAALRLAGVFVVRLLRATVVVARTVVAPRDRIETGIVAVPLSGCSDALATLLADAISLTPGTLTLEVQRDPLTLYVHVLDLRDVEQVGQEVRSLEVLVVRAFGGPEALAGLEADDSRAWRIS